MHCILYHKLHIVFIFVDILSDLEISMAINGPEDSMLLFDTGSFIEPVIRSFNSLHFLDFYFTFLQSARLLPPMLFPGPYWAIITGSNYPVIQGASITLLVPAAVSRWQLHLESIAVVHP